jgi:AsmA protein
MPSLTGRKGVLAFAVGVSLAVALVVSLPLIASTQIVRSRVAQELSAWSGYRVSLGEAPEIKVWPTFRAVLKNVGFREWAGEAGAPPVLRADVIEMQLSPLSAILGRVTFSRVKLVRPDLLVSRASGGALMPASPGGGQLYEAFEGARSAELPGEAGASEKLGLVQFFEGRILASEGGSEEEVATSLTGEISWPQLSSPASLSATGIWRGEAVQISLLAQKPADLLGGRDAPIEASLSAVPLEGSFDGTVRLAPQPVFEGALSLQSPSLRRTLEWTRTASTLGAAVGAVTLSGKMQGGPTRLRIDDAELALGGDLGKGVLEVAFGPRTSVSGTLAFDRVDLMSLLSEFSPAEQPGAQRADPALNGDIDLDLRLSAAAASGGPLELSKVAATAQIRDGLAAIDLSDATLFGGSLQAGFRAERKDGASQSELRLVAEDIDWAQLSAAAGFVDHIAKSRGSLSLVLKGPASSAQALLRLGSGTLNAKLGPGLISGVDLPALLKRAEEGGFFPLTEVSAGALAIDGAELKAQVSNGVARLESARAWTEQRLINIYGMVPYVDQSLALSGTVGPTEAAVNSGVPVTEFFVGGSWDAPYISRIYPNLPSE